MANKIFTIDNFSGGMIDNINKYFTGFCSVMNNVDSERELGTLQLSRSTSTVGISAVSGLANFGIGYLSHYYGDTTYRFYAHDNGFLYAGDDLTDEVKFIRRLSNTTSGSQYGINNTSQLFEYADDTAGETSLYYGSNFYLGKYDGSTTTFDDMYKPLSVSGFSTTGPFFENFTGNLCVGSGRYIDTLEGDGTIWNQSALVLPLGSNIRQMTVWGNYLLTNCSFTNDFAGNGKKSRIYFWDGTSKTYNDVIEQNESYGLIFVYENVLYKIASGLIYRFNGATFDPVRKIIDTDFTYANAITTFDNNIVLGTNNYIGFYGRKDMSNPLSYKRKLSIPLTSLTSAGNGQITSMINLKSRLYFTYTDFYGNDGIARSNTAQNSEEGSYESSWIDMGSSWRLKYFKSFKLDLNPLESSDDTIDVYYRLDDNSTWISLCNVNSTNQNDWQSITYRGRKIQLKLEFNTGTTSTTTPELKSIHIMYQDLGIEK